MSDVMADGCDVEGKEVLVPERAIEKGDAARSTFTP